MPEPERTMGECVCARARTFTSRVDITQCDRITHKWKMSGFFKNCC